MPEVLKAEEQKSQENTNSSRIEDEDTRAIPRRLAEIITQTEAVLEVIASSADFTTFGEPLPAPLPFPSPIYSATTAYFLTWELILTLISQASAELRPKYSAFLRKSNYLKTLMDTLFHIMPMKVSIKKIWKILKIEFFITFFLSKIRLLECVLCAKIQIDFFLISMFIPK